MTQSHMSQRKMRRFQTENKGRSFPPPLKAFTILLFGACHLNHSTEESAVRWTSTGYCGDTRRGLPKWPFFSARDASKLSRGPELVLHVSHEVSGSACVVCMPQQDAMVILWLLDTRSAAY